jgi:hypothetical protein
VWMHPEAVPWGHVTFLGGGDARVLMKCLSIASGFSYQTAVSAPHQRPRCVLIVSSSN